MDSPDKVNGICHLHASLHLAITGGIKDRRARYIYQTLLREKVETSSIARDLDQAVKRPISFVHCAAIEGKLDTRVRQIMARRKLIGPGSIDVLQLGNRVTRVYYLRGKYRL